MFLNIGMKFMLFAIGVLGFAGTSYAQAASQRPVSELYKDARVERHTTKPFRQPSASPGKVAKTLPSEQRILTPPKSKLRQPANHTSGKVSVQQGKKGLPSNSNQSIQKYNRRRQIDKPRVPTPEAGRISG